MEPLRIEQLRRTGYIIWNLVGVLALLTALVWGATRIKVIFAPLVLALALIYLVNPLVSLLERRRLPRLLGSCLSYVVLGGLAVLVGFVIAPTLREQGSELVDRFPQIVTDLGERSSDLAKRLGIDFKSPELTGVSVSDWLNDPDNRALLGSQLGRAFEITLTVLEAILVIILGPVLALYLLIDLPNTQRRLIDLVPDRLRSEVLFVGREVSHTVGGFVRGQLVVALIVGLLMSIGFRVINLPFWLLIGLISGFLNIIPFVGPWVGGALGAVVGLTSGEPSKALYAAIVAAGIQQIDNHFISPVVLRTTVRLHPVTIILSLLGGGAVGGLFGVFLSVPVVAVGKILLGHLWRTRILGQSWAEAAREMVAVPAAIVEIGPGQPGGLQSGSMDPPQPDGD